ncbi:MAG TPA: hypothetical protein DD391_05035 [Clostridiales bacterium]|jgi:hypothetical protein|nr:hypothetical protein [Clostridiales bacterium]HBL81952.1 hypothetical protein [Clostridiales bacterium]
MFDSGISADNFINQLMDEIDIAVPMPRFVYVDCMNTVEQLLYSEVIREQANICVAGRNLSNEAINLSSLPVGENEAPICYEDIHCVFSDEIQLIETNLTSNSIFLHSYCKENGKLRINVKEKPQELRITYFVRPVIRTIGENNVITGGNIHLPVFFMDLIRAKVRGEIYMLAGEYAHAANWLGIYNAQLENFKAYVQVHTPVFGL